MEWKLTKVYEINNHLVVADNAEDAIELYKNYLLPAEAPIEELKLVKSSGYIQNENALAKK